MRSETGGRLEQALIKKMTAIDAARSNEGFIQSVESAQNRIRLIEEVRNFLVLLFPL
jgi:hypothetical protein